MNEKDQRQPYISSPRNVMILSNVNVVVRGQVKSKNSSLPGRGMDVICYARILAA